MLQIWLIKILLKIVLEKYSKTPVLCKSKQCSQKVLSAMGYVSIHKAQEKILTAPMVQDISGSVAPLMLARINDDRCSYA